MAHAHHHHHDHAPKEFDKAFFIAIVANGLFVVFQVIFAYIANSTSLLADGIHNLGDVLSLVLAWIANKLLKKQPTKRSTYGLKKISILAALINGVLLVFSCGVIVAEAVYKFFSPAPIEAGYVMLIAGIGIIINALSALLFIGGKHDLNIRAAFLHLMYDALLSFSVVVAAFILYWTNWLWIDPLMGLIIAFIILKGTWSLFKDSFLMIIDGVPRGISWEEVCKEFENVYGVKQVHDLHIWALSTRENALSVHLWMPEKALTDEDRAKLIQILVKKYNIHHTTIQVEKNLDFCKDGCLGSRLFRLLAI